MADIVRATPTDMEVTHDVELISGSTTIGLILADNKGQPIQIGQPWPFRQSGSPRTVMQIAQGDADYGSFEMPFTPFTQKDWSGGRGNEDFEKDKTRFNDVCGLDTTGGDIILGPTIHYGAYNPGGLQIQSNAQTGQYQIPNPASDGTTWFTGPGQYINGQYFGSEFKNTLTKTVTSLKLWLAKTTMVHIVIFSTPQTPDLSTIFAQQAFTNAQQQGISSANYTVVLNTYQNVDWSDTLMAYTFPINVNMVNNGYYFLSIGACDNYTNQAEGVPGQCIIGTGAANGYEDVWSLNGYFNARLGGVLHSNINGTMDWAVNMFSLAYELDAADTSPSGAQYFEYHGNLFFVTVPNSGNSPQVFMEGYHGITPVANTGTLSQTNARNVGVDAIGGWILIIAGAGATEETPWRKITAVVTGASGYVTVDQPWYQTQGTDTEYAIIGTGSFTEVTGHGLAHPITDLCIVDDIVYFAAGDAYSIRRMSGVYPNLNWAWEKGSNDLNGTKATYLALIADTSGKNKLWKALSRTAKVACADVVAWGTDLTFGTDIQCGSAASKITGLAKYGDPAIPWVLKEDTIGNIGGNGIGTPPYVYSPVPICEMGNVRSERNGRAWTQAGVYLYFNLLDGLERYYNNRLDDIGPNQDLGFPSGRKGIITKLINYPGRLYAIHDAGFYGYSSVLSYNQLGWHEIYRAPIGTKIRTLFVQVIPGAENCDRLWISLGQNPCWFSICLNPLQQSDYQYASSGQIVSSWINGQFREFNKYWGELAIFAENLSAGYQQITAEYQTDASSTWIPVPGVFATSPLTRLPLTADDSCYGKRWRYRLTLTTANPTLTPRIKALTVDAITRIKPKKAWTMTFLADDQIVDRNGDEQTLGALALLNIIDRWVDSEQTPCPILLRSPFAMFDSKHIMLDSPSLQPVEMVVDENTRQAKLLVTLPFYEV
jgi:hypothetical protein